MSRYYFIENSFNWEEGSIKVFPQLFYTNCDQNAGMVPCILTAQKEKVYTPM